MYVEIYSDIYNISFFFFHHTYKYQFSKVRYNRNSYLQFHIRGEAEYLPLPCNPTDQQTVSVAH